MEMALAGAVPCCCGDLSPRESIKEEQGKLLHSVFSS